MYTTSFFTQKQQHQQKSHIFLFQNELFGLKKHNSQDLPLLVFGPLSAFLATLATRGRVLVAMVAGVLALAVPLVTSIGFLTQQKEDGQEEVGTGWVGKIGWKVEHPTWKLVGMLFFGADHVNMTFWFENS